MAKRYYWLKLKEDFFRNKVIKKLRKVAGGDTYVIIYLKLQLLSLHNEGVLIYDGLEKTFAKELALEIDEDEIDIDFLLHFLKQSQLLKEFDDNEFTLIGTVESLGSESASAERVRQFRKRKKEELPLPKEKYYRKFAHLKLTQKEFDKLIEDGFTKSQIDNTLDSIENYRKNTSYKSLNLTLRKWLKKDTKNDLSNAPDYSEYEIKHDVDNTEEAEDIFEGGL